MPSDLLTLEDIRDELQGEVSLQTLRRKIKNGELLRAVRLGRKFLVRRAWVDEMIDRESKAWVEHESTNTNLASSGSANDPAAPLGTSCGTMRGRAALSDFQRAQKTLTKPSGN
jgi:excisionase family DNA binding protein